MIIFLSFILIVNILLLAASLIVFSSLIIFSIVKVPYVQTPKKGVEKMFKLAKIKPNEKVYDLGCGNGNLVFKAEKEYQADACGYELSPWPYSLARIRKSFKKYKSSIICKNFLKQNLSDADVIFCFLMPGACEKLGKKLDRELSSKTRIISYGFGLLNLKNFQLQEKCYNKNTPIFHYARIQNKES